MGSLSVYGTTIRGCGEVLDTWYNLSGIIVNSTYYGYRCIFLVLATGKRAYFRVISNPYAECEIQIIILIINRSRTFSP